MTAVVVDASVALKWILDEDEREVPESRALLTALTRGALEAHVLELTHCEVGNALVRRRRWPAPDVVQQLDDLAAWCGRGLPLTRGIRAAAARLAEGHDLTFYDAAYWAAADAAGATLVTADAELIRAGAGESPAALCERLGLSIGR